MLTILIIVTLLYILAIGALILGFYKVDDFKVNDAKPQLKFSVIIPFRNEANSLQLLLESINDLKYPVSHFEFIFVDDDSSDNSSSLINNYFENKPIQFQIHNNKIKSGSPKKDAISLGINNAKFNWIVTTDADCRLPLYWLDAYDSFINSTKTELVVAPVMFSNSTNFLDKFQITDMLSLQGATIGGFGINKPFLCNGANLCYSKSIFERLNGFDGNENVASGDDMFLLQNAVKLSPDKVGYLKSIHAIVKTKTQPSFKSLLNQRIRWASKSKSYRSIFSKLIAIIVFLMNAGFVAAIVMGILGVITPKSLLYIVIIKSGLDFLMIFKSARFFDKESILLSYPVVSIIYPFFVVLVGIMSSFGAYKWKGRSHRD